MKAVILDAATLGQGTDLTAIRECVDELQCYAATNSDETVERIAEADIVITNKVVLNRDVLSQTPAVKQICVLATGMNNIDLDCAQQQGIRVDNVEAYGTDSVAQHTLMMMLSLSAKQPVMQQRIGNGAWQQSELFCLLDPAIAQLAGKQLVLVGSGELGQAVAKLAQAFGMRVTFSARPGRDNDSRLSFQQLLKTADVISFHCPLTEHTRQLLNATNLPLCKPDVLVINNARGGVINEQDCLTALRDGRIGGLATDVLPQEPPRDGHPLLSAMHETLNLIVTPHHAWTSPEARQRIIELTADNIKAMMSVE